MQVSLRPTMFALCILGSLCTPAPLHARERTLSRSPSDLQGAQHTAAAATVPDKVAGAAPAQAEELAKQRAAAHGLLVKGLLELATWCNTKELYLERDHLYQRVLEIEPDNLDARKGLRYARNPDGSWKEPAPREAKNRNPKALEELPQKRAEAIAAWRDALIDMLDKLHPDPAARKSVFDEILTADPDDARVHKLLDEIKADGKWVMPETAAGKKRRAELKAMVKKSLETAPQTSPDVANANEASWQSWTSVVQCDGVRVLGTVSADECQHIARTCRAAGELVQSLFGCKVVYPEAYTLYVFGSPGEKDAVIDKIPDLRPDDRAYMHSMSSVGLSDTFNVLLGDADPAKRMDCAVRHTLIHLMRGAYGLDAQQGWAWEGLGLYLTRELVGTRYTWFILASPGSEHESLRGSLLTPASNWMNEALKLLESPKPASVPALAARELSAMHLEDMLCAYALAAYLIEGRPAEVPEVLRRVGGGDTTAAAVQETLGMTLEELQERMTRWLKERH